MSNERKYTYGKDMKYQLNSDGSVDLSISPSGDIDIIGGDSTDSEVVRRSNAIQHIILRIITPFGAIKDALGQDRDFGSYMYQLIGAKDTELNQLTAKAMILASLQSYPAIERIDAIDIIFNVKGQMVIQTKIKIRGDTEPYYETVVLGETE